VTPLRATDRHRADHVQQMKPYDERRLLITIEGGGQIVASRKASEELTTSSAISGGWVSSRRGGRSPDSICDSSIVLVVDRSNRHHLGQELSRPLTFSRARGLQPLANAGGKRRWRCPQLRGNSPLNLEFLEWRIGSELFGHRCAVTTNTPEPP